MMEISYLKALLDGISQFRLISSKTVAKPELVQKYCQEIDEILKCIKPVLDEIINHEIALAEQLIKMLEEVNAFVDEACGLVESWHQMMSKVYFVLQIESVITKIQGSVLESCSLLSSLFQSLEVYSGLDCVQQCVREIQQLPSIQTSNIIREAMRDRMENNIPKPQHLVEITDSVCLSTNQELLMETVALDKLKMTYARGENHGEVEYIDHMIALITHLHECHVEKYQVHSINNIPIPADFCCPLSLNLMSDPVIVASGQTYERAFIKQWLDQGFTVCPKTRQTLGHTNLIPNYTVKALIENWCDTNNIKLPDPTKSMNVNHTSNLLAHADHSTDDSSGHLVGTNYPKSPESNRSTIHRNSVTSNGPHHEVHLNDRSHHDSVSVDSSSLDADGVQADISRLSLAGSNSEEPHLEKQHGYSGGQTSALSNDSSHAGKEQLEGHNRSASASSAVYGSDYLQGAGDENNDRTQNNSGGASGKVKLGAPSPSFLPRELEFPPRLGDSRSRSQTIWRRPSDRFSPRIVSPPSHETRPDLTGVETVVRKLIEDLKTDSIDGQRDATAELRLLAKHSMENRIVIANCGAIEILVNLLNSSDLKMQENAVTALLNLSINDNNKFAIANANCIEPLMHVLRFGNPEAKENAAATIFSLSVIEENKVKIGRSGAIGPLVDLLGNGTPRGKKDAATALFNLSIFHENKARIVQAGAVKHLVELMDPAAGMVDKAVAVLANLSTIPEGRSAIGHEGGIPVLVEVVELGTTRGKENAAAALLQLCTNSNKFCSIVLQEGAVPPLVALSQTGTSRAKEKAQALLSYFRNQRHGSVGRS